MATYTKILKDIPDKIEQIKNKFTRKNTETVDNER